MLHPKTQILQIVYRYVYCIAGVPEEVPGIIGDYAFGFVIPSKQHKESTIFIFIKNVFIVAD